MMDYSTINDVMTMQSGENPLLAGRYRVVRQLGQGGMGSVLLAEDRQLDNKLFAIKMLPSILVSNKRAYRQLKDEALVAMKLVHPNIVQLRAFEENNGNPFLVMDYIEGETLDDYIGERPTGGTAVSAVYNGERGTGNGEHGTGNGRARSPSAPQGGLSESDVLRILRPIAAALDYAHSKGVVHRDVKPGNVMIAKDGTPYILDFGIAREIQETMTRVTGKLSSGTLLYMSPEQLNGEAPKPSQDIYSFAAMVYECLKGEPPFVRGAIEDQIKNKIPEPPVGRDAPIAPLVAGIMAGLAKKPEDRPKTCAAVLEGNVSRGGAETRRNGYGNGRARTPAAPVGKEFSRGGAETKRTNGAGKVLAVLAFVAAIAVGWLYVNARAARSTGGMGVPPVARQETTGGMGVSPVAAKDTTGGTGVSPVIFDAGHEGVQLWEGGPYWATTNIGAEKPEDYGLYFWWGDTAGHRPSGTKFDFYFSKDNPAIYTYGKSVWQLQSSGWVTKSGVLAPEYDAAHVKWGGKWRMPTEQELEDLNDSCDWEWTAINGVNGYNVRGKGAYASKSIFLPCAGYGDRTSLYYAGSHGLYWSSVPYSDNIIYVAGYLYFKSGDHSTSPSRRGYGQSVRPVQGFAK